MCYTIMLYVKGIIVLPVAGKMQLFSSENFWRRSVARRHLWARNGHAGFQNQLSNKQNKSLQNSIQNHFLYSNFSC